MAGSKNPLLNIVRAGLEKMCTEFTARVDPLDFHRTLMVFWTRRHPLIVNFIHFRRGGSTFGAPRTPSLAFRVHFGIRVLNDDSIAPALNGPQSDPATLRAGRFHLRFNTETGRTYDRCLDDLTRFVMEHGEPWFQRWNSVDALLESPDSPLKPRERDFLRAARDGQASPDRIAASLKMLGIKGP